MVKLIADTRERAVIPFIEVEHDIQQMPIGDYIIESDDGIPLACFERKTLADYGASIRDGRKYENFDKMFGLRDASPHLQLYLILEGDFMPVSQEDKHGGIKYSSILSSATNLMVERGVFMIQTQDKKHTAIRLGQLLASFGKRRPNATENKAADAKTTNAMELRYSGTGNGASVRFIRSDEEEAKLCLSAVPGISVETANIILSHHSIIELIMEPSLISGISRPNGRKIGAAVERTFTAFRMSVDDAAKMLSKITGIAGTTGIKSTVITQSLVQMSIADKIDGINDVLSEKIIRIINTKKN